MVVCANIQGPHLYKRLSIIAPEPVYCHIKLLELNSNWDQILLIGGHQLE